MAWTCVASLADFGGRCVIGVAHGDARIALFRLDDGVYATADACPHLSARLSDGEVVDGLIECPAHYALFDIRSGRCEGGVAAKAVQTYPARIVAGRIEIGIDG